MGQVTNVRQLSTFQRSEDAQPLVGSQDVVVCAVEKGASASAAAEATAMLLRNILGPNCELWLSVRSSDGWAYESGYDGFSQPGR